jgi:hypothetical protein
MITGVNNERIDFAKKSIQNFKDQTHESKHLIILNQSKEKLVLDDHPSILEVFVEKGNKSLGELRNMSLQFVPPNAIWTTWDDDDWRAPKYIATMVNTMNKERANFLMFQNRIEYNSLNDYSFQLSLKNGLMTFFSVYNKNLQYEHVSTSEDLKVKKYAMKHIKTHIYNNDPTLYIRLIHKNNTSVYVDTNKNNLKNTNNNKVYFENKLNKKEQEYVDNIISKYYK